MEKKQKNSAKELEIPIYFHNYKLLKDKEFVLKGSNIYFIQGPNKVGKTSFLKALTSLQIAQDDTPEKVTKGESEGSYEATIPAANGEMITVRHEFTDDGKSKFIAIKEDGTKVSKVTEIRELFNYTPIDVNQFFAMSLTAEGRRKQRDIILKLLTAEERTRFNELDLLEQGYYNTRTETNRALEQAENNIKAVNIPEEDLALLPREKEAKDLKALYENVRDARKILKAQNTANAELETTIRNLNREIEEKQAELKRVVDLVEKGKEANKELEEKIAKYQHLTDDEISVKIETGDKIITRITSIITKKELIEEYTAKRDNKKAESESLSKKIEDCRIKKEEIVSNSDLPVKNISFEDGYLTIDGFQFKESQVCESDAVIILANILAKINPGPVQIIGDASILDSEKLELLNKIAESNNKVMFVDEVVRDANNMVVVGYESLSKEDLNNKFQTIAETGASEKQITKQKGRKKKYEEPTMPSDAIPPDNDNNESSQGEENTEKPLF